MKEDMDSLQIHFNDIRFLVNILFKQTLKIIKEVRDEEVLKQVITLYSTILDIQNKLDTIDLT